MIVWRSVSTIATLTSVVVRTPAGQASYRACGEATHAHHHHLICRVCGRTLEVEFEGVEELIAALAAQHGFTDVDHSFELHGLCATCAAATDSPISVHSRMMGSALRVSVPGKRACSGLKPTACVGSTSTYVFDHLGDEPAYDYSRAGNPTRDLLGDALADLEQGAGAVITSSGMSAVALALELVPAGATVLAAHDSRKKQEADAWKSGH